MDVKPAKPAYPGASVSEFVVAWDLESVPDLSCVARVHKLDETDEDGCRETLGEKFPKHVFHKVACIGALVAERTPTGWEVRSLGAPHVILALTNASVASAGTNCALIKNADLRWYCRAKVERKVGYRGSIRDNDLRALCRAVTFK
jgi:hypothetical protein